jgi:hypothetical protein
MSTPAAPRPRCGRTPRAARARPAVAVVLAGEGAQRRGEGKRGRVAPVAPGQPAGPCSQARGERRRGQQQAAAKRAGRDRRRRPVGTQLPAAGAGRSASGDRGDFDRPCRHQLGGLRGVAVQAPRGNAHGGQRQRCVDHLVVDDQPAPAVRRALHPGRTPLDPTAQPLRAGQALGRRGAIRGQQHALRQDVAHDMAERTRLFDPSRDGRGGGPGAVAAPGKTAPASASAQRHPQACPRVMPRPRAGGWTAPARRTRRAA